MKRFFFILILTLVGAATARAALNALTWCKADGTDQTANMQTAVNVAVMAGQSLAVPPGITVNWNAITNTSMVLIEDYSTHGRKTFHGSVKADKVITQGNVIWHGADPTGVADSTAAFVAAAQYARTNKSPMIVPGGEFSVSTLDLSGVPIVQGDGSLYSLASTIKHRLGSTNDLITLTASPSFRPIIRDIVFAGRREQNLRNMRTITAVASRTAFTVSSAPPDASYAKEAFFFLSDANGYHYLGSGVVSSIVGNDVTIYNTQDWFATPTSAGGQLNTSCVVCFGERVTDAPSGLITSDPTRAGYCAINLPNIGGYIQLENVRFDDWHCDIRIGVAGALSTSETFHRAFSLAALYCVYGAGGDHRVGVLEAGGGYATQSGVTATATALTDPLYRSSKYGVYIGGSVFKIGTLQIYSCIRNAYFYYAWPVSIDKIDFASSVREQIVLDNFSQVQVGTLWALNSGILADDTYPVVLNVNSKLDAASVAAFNVGGWAQKASFFLDSTTADAHTRIGSIVSISGCTALETSYNNQSCIDSYADGENFTSGRQLTGGSWVYKGGSTAYGMSMAGDGSSTNQFRLRLSAGSAEFPGIRIFSNNKVTIGSTTDNGFPIYPVVMTGDTGISGKVVPYYVFMPTLTAGAGNLPPVDASAVAWFTTQDEAGNPTMAARFHSGQIVYYINDDADLNLHNVTVTNVASVADGRFGSVTVTNDLSAASISTPLFNVGTLNTTTITVTNGIIYKAIADGPSAAAIGAGNAAFWISNSVPATLYYRTSDGATTVDTPFP